MSIWAKEPRLMANAKRRKDKLVAALVEEGIDFRKWDSARAAGAEVVWITKKGSRAPVFFITLRGLEAIAKHAGLEIP